MVEHRIGTRAALLTAHRELAGPEAASASRASPAAATAALVATLGVAAVAWVLALDRMDGMDMGVETELGSFGFFVVAWVSMMAAMMLPGAVPAVLRRARAGGPVSAGPLFAASYLAVWTLFGLAAYALYHPHSTLAAGGLTIVAGAYELTPLKRASRRRCQRERPSGFDFGINCLGSSIGLMLLLLAVGPMSVTWMGAVAALVLTQKLLPPRGLVDVPVALAIVAFGLAVAVAPSSIPGLTPPM